ncbi:RluA family pseudouridine synthase [Geoalkalibacter sp.]|uniref:RluA family pseudouridine synthase n=1 Tax=Geoalkalibacter sp. TaxID=3041440 RepID=UPI00272EE0EF|nr:RluA family pseudouridine synthase [Geoalkalibacter sp.]
MRGQAELYRLQVAAEESGQRLDQFLASRAAHSRTFWRRIIDLGGVHVAGRRIRQCGYQVQGAQQVEAYVDGLPLEPFVLEDRHILFRDRYLLALDKPAGVDTQPTHARFKGTLYEALLRFLQDPFRPQSPPALGMVQRLDRDTSGVLVFSIHPRAHKPLTEAIGARRLDKVYLALVQGVPKARAGEIRSQLARGRRDNRMKSVEQGGREALTRYRVTRTWEAAALLEVEIPTGRSHQIRVHLAELGHPLLGDTAYGGPEGIAGAPVARQMLHSLRLDLKHPVSGEPLSLTAPVPCDMKQLMAHLDAGQGAAPQSLPRTEHPC